MCRIPSGQLADFDRCAGKDCPVGRAGSGRTRYLRVGNHQNVRGLLGRTGLQKPVSVALDDGIATVTVHLTANYGQKIMPLCEKVQENVKQTIQNMTGITVSRVDVLVVGLAQPEAED